MKFRLFKTWFTTSNELTVHLTMESGNEVAEITTDIENYIPGTVADIDSVEVIIHPCSRSLRIIVLV